MCGITGILGIKDKRMITRMTQSIKHRGPDDWGFFLDEDISLGHRRLSIIDLEGGKQPIYNEDKQIAIVFNGEIYNFKALRDGLEKNHTFYTNTDTEVIIHLYEEYGLDFVKYLEGIFALAIYDRNKKILVLARDHMGIKPLFYAKVDGALIFGSEIKSILMSGLFQAEINENALKEKYVFENYLLDDQTLFKRIRQVNQSALLVVKGVDDICEIKYTKREYTSKISDEALAKKKVLDILKKSVNSRLMSDVPLGTMLSGGIDSSVVACLHRELVGDKSLHTFNVTDSCGSDDSRKAKLVAESINSTHHEFVFDFQDIIENLPSFVYHLEDVEYGIIYNYFLSKGTKKFATVVLSGNGADEIFGGYDRYKNVEKTKNNFMSDINGIGLQNFTQGKKTVASLKTLNDMLAFEQNRGPLSNFQLSQLDRLSMAFGVEVRVPFLQKELVTLCNNIDPKLKIRNGVEKYILRKAVSKLKLPSIIKSRPKVAGGLANTTPVVMPKFEAYCKKLVENKKGKYDRFFKKPGKKVCFDLMRHIFIEEDGKIPKGLSITDLY